MVAADRAAPAPDETLARLVGDPQRFAAEHWDARPLLRRGAWDVEPPLTLDDVDRLLTASGLRWPAFRLVREGRTLPAGRCTRAGRIGGQPVDDLADPGRVLAEVHDGATLVLQGLHRFHAPVAAVCADLEAATSHPVQANAYLTPPASRGLDVHHDTHDVFALQAHGRKHWVVHEPALEAPLPSQAWSSATHDPGPVLHDVELEPGDVLYLPRGAPHAAETLEGISLHLTIGVRAVTWHDVLRRAVTRLGEDRSLREALPLGFAGDVERLAADVAARLDDASGRLGALPADELARGLVAERRRRSWPPARGWLLETLSLDAVDDDTTVRRRDGVPVDLRRDGEVVVLSLPDRDVSLPGAVEPVLHRLLDGCVHRVGDLSERLDQQSRAVLVRRLVREGALTTRGTPGG